MLPTKFGRILRYERWNARKTLQELADFVDCSVSYISEIERGIKPPPVNSFVEKIVDCLGCRTNELIETANRERLLLPSNVNKFLKECDEFQSHLISVILENDFKGENCLRLVNEAYKIVDPDQKSESGTKSRDLPYSVEVRNFLTKEWNISASFMHKDDADRWTGFLYLTLQAATAKGVTTPVRLFDNKSGEVIIEY